MAQPTLFDGPAFDAEPASRLVEKFRRFDAKHPDVYRLFVRFASELRKAGRDRCSHWLIVNRIRWECFTTSQGRGEYKIPNDYIALYARKLVAERPEFDGFFELRPMKRG